MRVALITGRDMPGPDSETPLLIEALSAIGIDSEVAVWRSLRDWSQCELTVLRTPWDYSSHLEEFLAWISHVSSVSCLRNSADVVQWNIHKKYLLELGQHGVTTVPTQMLQTNASIDAETELHTIARQLGWRDIVVKPAVGINAVGSMRAPANDPALARHLARLLRNGDALVQPFLPAIVRAGEISLVFVDSIYTHAVRKLPRSGDYRVQDNHGGTVEVYEPSADEISIASEALHIVPSRTTYARVDLAYFEGAPVVMELELIEPELFLRFSPKAVDLLANALKCALYR